MTAKDRWTVDLSCKDCETTGSADVWQNDGWSFERDPSTYISSIQGPFKGIDGTKSESPKYTCINCGKGV